MLKRVINVFALALSLAPTAVMAEGTEIKQSIYGSTYYARPNHFAMTTGLILQSHYRSVFLGCVYSYHECEHLAHDRGFYNHFTRHDHGTCHHGPSYACFGE
jgi:hypothetical protein